MSDLDQLKKLREPFKGEQISKLPKPTFKGAWDNSPKARCQECKGYHPVNNTIHLDYVGHAALTDRLLEVDPEWTWEPMGIDEHGLPAFDRLGGLWIKLTVCGVTRLGYGDAQGKSGPNAVKEAIGDALRNAGMRFGAALDLWHKGDLHDSQEQQVQQQQNADLTDAIAELDDLCVTWKLDAKETADRFYAQYKKPARQATAEQVREFIDQLHEEHKAAS